MQRFLPRLAACLGLSLFAGCIGVSQARRAPAGASAQGGIRSCARGVRVAADGDLDDFEDGNTQLTRLAGRAGSWWTKKDDFGSTISMMPDDGGAGGSEIAMHVAGRTTTGKGDENWGAGFGVDFLGQGRFYDASKYAGIAFRARAGPKSSRQVRFKIGDVNTHPDGKLCSKCWNHFGMDLTLTADWREYRVLFAEVEQEAGWGAPRPSAVTPSKLLAIDWTIGPGQTYDLWLDDLVLLECKE
jgi:hypothetical protein